MAAALARHPRVVPVYIHAPAEEAPWSPGAASRWWLHHGLEALARDIAARGGRLVLRRVDSLTTLRALVRETGVTVRFWNRLYEPVTGARDGMPYQRFIRLALERALHRRTQAPRSAAATTRRREVRRQDRAR